MQTRDHPIVLLTVVKGLRWQKNLSRFYFVNSCGDINLSEISPFLSKLLESSSLITRINATAFIAQLLLIILLEIPRHSGFK